MESARFSGKKVPYLLGVCHTSLQYTSQRGKRKITFHHAKGYD